MFLLGGGRRRRDQELEQALKDVEFWKAELEHTVEEKNQWRDKFTSAQRHLREVEHLRKQVLQLREEKHHAGKQYDRSLQEIQRLRAQLRGPQGAQAEDSPAAAPRRWSNGAAHGSDDPREVPLLEERVAELLNEADLLHRQNALLRASEAAFQQEAKVLREELRNQSGINEYTAEETTKLLLEISRLQQQNAQLQQDVLHRDEMLRLVQGQLADLAPGEPFTPHAVSPGMLTPCGQGSMDPSPRHRPSSCLEPSFQPPSPLAALHGLNLRTVSFDAVLAAQRRLSIRTGAADDAQALHQVSPARSAYAALAHTPRSPALHSSPSLQSSPAVAAAPATRSPKLEALQEESSEAGSSSSAAAARREAGLQQRLRQPGGLMAPAAAAADAAPSQSISLRESRLTVYSFAVAMSQESSEVEGPESEAAAATGSAERDTHEGMALAAVDEPAQGSQEPALEPASEVPADEAVADETAQESAADPSMQQPGTAAEHEGRQSIQLHVSSTGLTSEQQEVLQALSSCSSLPQVLAADCISSNASSAAPSLKQLCRLEQDVARSQELDQDQAPQQPLKAGPSKTSPLAAAAGSPLRGSQQGPPAGPLQQLAPELYASAQGLAVQAALSQDTHSATSLAQLKSRFQAVRGRRQQQQQQHDQPEGMGSPDSCNMARGGEHVPLRVRVLGAASMRAGADSISQHRYDTSTLSVSGSNTLEEGEEEEVEEEEEDNSMCSTPTSRLQQPGGSSQLQDEEQGSCSARASQMGPPTRQQQQGEADKACSAASSREVKGSESTAIEPVDLRPCTAGNRRTSPPTSPVAAKVLWRSIDFSEPGIPQRQLALAALAGNGVLPAAIVPKAGTKRLLQDNGGGHIADGSGSSSRILPAAQALADVPVVVPAGIAPAPARKVASMRAAFEKGRLC